MRFPMYYGADSLRPSVPDARGDASRTMQTAREMRYPELDAVRGFAALSVLAFHYTLMWYPPEAFDHGWRSLLYPLIAGHEAVLLFFLLSGLALAKMLFGAGTSFQCYAGR